MDISRREFFKVAIKKAIPFLGLVVLAPALLEACSKDDDPQGCNNSCMGTAQSGCGSTCSKGCTGSSQGGCGCSCKSGCKESCSSGCDDTAKSSSCSNCGTSCSNGCKDGCNDNCKGTSPLPHHPPGQCLPHPQQYHFLHRP